MTRQVSDRVATVNVNLAFSLFSNSSDLLFPMDLVPTRFFGYDSSACTKYTINETIKPPR